MKIEEKITLVWSLLCSNSTVDNTTNNFSLFNLIEQINVNINKEAYEEHLKKKTNGFMINIPIDLVSRFKKNSPEKPELFDFQIQFINPKGEILLKLEHTIDFKKGLKNMRVKNSIQKLPVRESGEYAFLLKIRDVGDGLFIEVGKIPLEINVQLPK